MRSIHWLAMPFLCACGSSFGQLEATLTGTIAGEDYASNFRAFTQGRFTRGISYGEASRESLRADVAAPAVLEGDGAPAYFFIDNLPVNGLHENWSGPAAVTIGFDGSFEQVYQGVASYQITDSQLRSRNTPWFNSFVFPGSVTLTNPAGEQLVLEGLVGSFAVHCDAPASGENCGSVLALAVESPVEVEANNRGLEFDTCPAEVTAAFYDPDTPISVRPSPHEAQIGDRGTMPCLDNANTNGQVAVQSCAGFAEVEADGCTWRVMGASARSGLIVSARAEDCESDVIPGAARHCSSGFGRPMGFE